MENTNKDQAEQLNETAVNHSVLTLEHLAPYLPYNLKSYDIASKGIFTICLDIAKYYIDRNLISTDKTFRLILRPMEDIRKELIFDDKKIIPIDFLGFENTDWSYTLLFEDNLEGLPYDMIIKLIEMHFDVFGLIKKGLAISIHDVE